MLFIFFLLTFFAFEITTFFLNFWSKHKGDFFFPQENPHGIYQIELMCLGHTHNPQTLGPIPFGTDAQATQTWLGKLGQKQAQVLSP